MPRKPKPPPEPDPKSAKRTYGSGSVFLNKDGTWTARLPRDANGRRQAKRHATEDDGLAWITKQLAPPPPPSSADEILGSYLVRWLERKEPGLRRQSRPRYRRAVKLCEPIALIPLHELNHTHFQDVIASMQRRDLDASTIRTTRSIIHAALQDAVPDILANNPLRRTTVGRVIKKQVACWSKAHAERVIQAAAGHFFEPLVRIGIKVGLRVGELMALQWGDLTSDGWLTVRRNQETTGKAVGPPKSGQERRIRLSPALSGWLLRQPRRGIWVVSRSDGQAYGRDQFARLLKQFAKTAGVTPLAPHAACRHTAANVMLREYVPITKVAQILGHHSPAFTLARYASCMPDDDNLSMAAMDSFAPESEPEGTEIGVTS